MVVELLKMRCVVSMILIDIAIYVDLFVKGLATRSFFVINYRCIDMEVISDWIKSFSMRVLYSWVVAPWWRFLFHFLMHFTIQISRFTFWFLEVSFLSLLIIAFGSEYISLSIAITAKLLFYSHSHAPFYYGTINKFSRMC